MRGIFLLVVALILSVILHSPLLLVCPHEVHSEGSQRDGMEHRSSTASSNSSDYGIPAAHGPSNRVLVMVLSYGFNRFDPLLALFASLQNMCEAGWDVDIVVFTTAVTSTRFELYLRDKLFCHRLQRSLDLQYSRHHPSIQHQLCAETRRHMKRVWQSYDVTVYLEEDMIIELRHLTYYLDTLRQLQSILGPSALTQYYPGFQRYRRHLRPFHLNKEPMNERQVEHQEFLEEIPFFRPICLLPSGHAYLQVTGNKRVPAANVYQAMWVLTRQQVAALQRKCGFLDQSSNPSTRGYIQEYMGSLSLLRNDLVGPSCDLLKVIPGERLLDSSVLHYYHSTDHLLLRTSHPLYGTHEHIVTGYIQSATPVAVAGYFDQLSCWRDIILRHRSLRNTSAFSFHQTGSSSSSFSSSIVLKQADSTTYVLRNGTKYPVDAAALRALGLDREVPVSMKHPLYDYLPTGDASSLV